MTDAKLARTAMTHLFAAVTGLLFIMVVRVCVVDVYRVPSESMSPTLARGDWIAVERLRFGPPLPFTSFHLPRMSVPRRADVVVFSSDDLVVPASGYGGSLVKRIVGRAGDTLTMRRGVLFLNGSKAPFTGLPTPRRGGDMSTVAMDWMNGQTLVGSRFDSTMAERTIDTWGPIVVPSDSVFVLGDNRYATIDSRHFGFVPVSAIRGVVRMIYFSMGRDSTGGLRLRLRRAGLVR